MMRFVQACHLNSLHHSTHYALQKYLECIRAGNLMRKAEETSGGRTDSSLEGDWMPAGGLILKVLTYTVDEKDMFSLVNSSLYCGGNLVFHVCARMFYHHRAVAWQMWSLEYSQDPEYSSIYDKLIFFPPLSPLKVLRRMYFHVYHVEINSSKANLCTGSFFSVV